MGTLEWLRTCVFRGKAGAKPVQRRCKAGRGAALHRGWTGIAPGLVRAEFENWSAPNTLIPWGSGLWPSNSKTKCRTPRSQIVNKICDICGLRRNLVSGAAKISEEKDERAC